MSSVTPNPFAVSGAAVSAYQAVTQSAPLKSVTLAQPTSSTSNTSSSTPSSQPSSVSSPSVVVTLSSISPSASAEATSATNLVYSAQPSATLASSSHSVSASSVSAGATQGGSGAAGETGEEPEQGATAVGQLTDQEQQLVEELAARDLEVRQHEQAHANVGGQYTGAPQLEYTRGPDGRMYATSGEVSVDTSTIAGDPQATIDKMEVIIRAAMAPAEPSAQDLQVAAQAKAMLAQAVAELASLEEENPLAGAEGEEETSADESQGEVTAGTSAAQNGNSENSESSDSNKRNDRKELNESLFNPANALAQKLINSGATQPPFEQGQLIDGYV
ncbi:MAG: putative metalloprotease CJM1_0395 family protein [Pontibacterium sp.]